MKKVIAILALLSLPATGALSWVGNGYVILDVDSGGNSFYYLDVADGSNPAFDSDDSSANAFSTTITIDQGDSIKLGGEAQTWDQGAGTTAYLGYRVSTDVTGDFTELNLPYDSSPGSNDKWQQAGGGMVEIGSSLSPGTHYLSIYLHANRNTDNVYNQEGGSGNDWEAKIEVLPESSTALLGALGLLGLLRRRR